ncbi:hypothetical protein D3C86_1190150 [compost metagenome]
MESPYKSVFFRIRDRGGIIRYTWTGEENTTRQYMRVFRLNGYNLNLTWADSCDTMVAFETYNLENVCVDRHSYTEFVKYTSLFSDTAWPCWGCFPTCDERCHDIHLGFVFRSDTDAALFKLACEFPTHVIDFPREFIYE